jgi:glucosamine-6-phosphate deaminase
MDQTTVVWLRPSDMASRGPTDTSPPIWRVRDAEAAGTFLAARILDRLAASSTDRPLLLGCPAGRTPVTTYAALGRLAASRTIDLSRIVIVMVDEYVVDGRWVEPTAHYSCRRFVDEHVGMLNDALRPPHRITEVWCPDPRDPASFDAEIDAEGGIDVFILASGASDGHVAFNPPGTPLDSATRVVELASTTRRDNLSTFPAFGHLDEVPRHGVTIGLRAIAAAREVVLLVLGADKAPSLARIVAADGFDPAWPASVINVCAAPLVVVDDAAAAGP